MDLFGRAGAFVTEDETIAFLELRVPKTARRLGGEEPESIRAAGRSEESLPVIVVADVEFVPVIHARATQLGVVDLETQRVDEMEHATRHSAHAAHVAGIRRDLRAEQDEVERRLHFRRLIAREISRLASRSLMS